MLEHCPKAQEAIEKLKGLNSKGDLVLLDYKTNGDLDDLSKPLSHAALVKRYLENNYPKL